MSLMLVTLVLQEFGRSQWLLALGIVLVTSIIALIIRICHDSIVVLVRSRYRGLTVVVVPGDAGPALRR
jgi:hypothetical protein